MQKNFFLTKTGKPAIKKKKFVIITAKRILLVIILILAVFLLANQVLALDVGLAPLSSTGLGNKDLRVIIAEIIRVALGFIGAVFLLLLLYGGFIYMTAAGNPEQVEKAKKILKNAVIGLLIILLSYSITYFILRYLLAAITGGPPSGVSYGSGGGALGNGIIESHYPPRNAINIPRNTSIVVTFKVPMNVDSIITSGKINTDSVLIHQTGNTANVTDVKAYNTPDLRTFVFKPNELLGSPDQATNYSVDLTPTIKKFDGGDAFGAYGGYTWSFEVSTFVDLTPPQVVSVIPMPSKTVPRNMVVQINFNEAINPITMSGTVQLTTEGAKVGRLRRDAQNLVNTFNDIIVCQEALPNSCNDSSANVIAGEFAYGNQYKTVEFTTNDLCGKNTCGGDVFCLPANKPIDILIKAAQLINTTGPSSQFPFTGIVDMADNSLDGNLDGKAQGPISQSLKTAAYYLNDHIVENKYVTFADQGDDALWSFNTNDKIDLEPPEIDRAILYAPIPNEIVEPRSDFQMTFTKLMMATTIKPGKGYGDGYCKCTKDSDCDNGCDFSKGYCKNSQGTRFVCNSASQTVCPQSKPCIEKDHITLVQPDPSVLTPLGYPGGGWAYWLDSFNLPDNDPNKSTAVVSHDLLGEYLPFSLKAGSGLKDLFQNCYQPCAGPRCDKESTGVPGQYQEGANWVPTGGFPYCKIP